MCKQVDVLVKLCFYIVKTTDCFRKNKSYFRDVILLQKNPFCVIVNIVPSSFQLSKVDIACLDLSVLNRDYYNNNTFDCKQIIR